MGDGETEVTLGTGRLLGLFFGLVVLCAIFFAVGYSLGRKSTGANATLTDSNLTSALPPGGRSPALQTVPPPKPDCANKPEGCAPAAPDSSDHAADSSTTPTVAAAPPASASQPAGAPEMSSPAVQGPGYVVQVAAVSKQQDADALVGALKKKQYAVFVGTSTTDSLFHVQIGPFADPKDAEAIRTRLIADGYNPIVKK